MKIEKILIVVELDNGNAHQVLASNDNKHLAINFLGRLENGIKLDKQLEPYTLKYDKTRIKK